MKLHLSWRIIALAVILLLFYLLMGKLLSNSLHHQNVRYTLDLTKTDIQTIEAAYKPQEPESFAALQEVLKLLLANNQDINSMAVVQKRDFVAHSEVEMIDGQITKEIFDRQREVAKNYDPQVKDSHFIWQKSEEEKGDYTSYTSYYGIFDGKKLIGFVVYDIKFQTKMPVQANQMLMIISIALFFVIAVLLEKFIPRYSAYISLILFILMVLLINNNIASQLENNHRLWLLNLEQYQLDLQQQLHHLLPDLDLQTPDWQTLIRGSIQTWNITLSVIGGLFILFILSGLFEKMLASIIRFKMAYSYIAPAMFGVFLLVFFPFVYGFLIGFTNYGLNDFGGNLIEYFGNLQNYSFWNFVDILKIIDFNDPHNFYYTLVHTILWTIINVVLHVSIGVGLALVLNNPQLKGRTVFRILLILPWAIPSYITALIWRGMFHKQFGAVNGFLELFGIEPISWFTQAHTAFLANLATNVWLGFPFMMIIALGALQSIPKELYEASAIDGSSRWQAFWNVTFPLLKPAMVPAVILGTIWTFNQFNVIYLVSGGGPDGATELLITDAYKIAFEQYRYGYAAAYCIVIFVLLFVYGFWTNKISRASEGVYE
ncbi:MAG: sugar ABC transporter permease [Candidatus Cloacimonetes bacterium]|nr:sugar ABC transporter permease [Candidatus Cloacimonadota bacterium]MCF7814365.1 sugar ABC transporter permease [Candidatus Cloacimonadota bacterium]MCF7868988.1 sugar ABC transporter permease [Candidatus Cloacimonadota bacterium]MCF7884382.1 sugar ABC transporter permease [Candidatus Cloacimonadota bacterium]